MINMNKFSIVMFMATTVSVVMAEKFDFIRNIDTSSLKQQLHTLDVKSKITLVSGYAERFCSQYPMYVPGVFFIGAAWSDYRKADKFVNTANFEKVVKLPQKGFVRMFKNAARGKMLCAVPFLTMYSYYKYNSNANQKDELLAKENVSEKQIH